MADPAAACSFLTFNLFADLPAFRHLDRRLEIAAAAIAAEQPAVVALQEIVRARNCGDMGGRLCELVNRHCNGTRYQLHYAVADGSGEDEWKFDEGVGLMSRHERALQEIAILKFSSQVRIMSRVGKREYRLPDDRVAMHVRYRVAPAIELDSYVTHLTDRSDQSAAGIRLNQARELIDWVQRTSQPANPVLIGGDFNDVPESETIRTLTDNGFTDLHAAAGSGAGYTNDRNDLDIEAPQANLNQRIDYIFFRPPRGRRFAIESVRLFLDQPSAEAGGRWLWASDHFGVLARLALD